MPTFRVASVSRDPNAAEVAPADPVELAEDAARRIRELTGIARHDVAIVLGTGLAEASQHIGTTATTVPFSDLPWFGSRVAVGHRPEICSVSLGARNVLVLRGRLHLYQGYSPNEVVHPVRTAVFTGCSTVFITNASGAIREGLAPGDMVLISDHLNLTGSSPLTGLGVSGDPVGNGEPSTFVDLTDAWSKRLRSLAKQVSPDLPEGVYAQLPGPQFETPAEIRMLRTMGADLVGMSSALEAIAARHLGAEVLGVSVVTNVAAGLAPVNLTARSVLEVALERAPALGVLLREVVRRM